MELEEELPTPNEEAEKDDNITTDTVHPITDKEA